MSDLLVHVDEKCTLNATRMSPEVSSIVVAIIKKHSDNLMIDAKDVEATRAICNELKASLGGEWTVTVHRGLTLETDATILHTTTGWDMMARYSDVNDLYVLMYVKSTIESPLKFARLMTPEEAAKELKSTKPIGLGVVEIMACKEAITKKKIVGKMKRTNSGIVKIARKIKKATKKKSV